MSASEDLAPEPVPESAQVPALVPAPEPARELALVPAPMPALEPAPDAGPVASDPDIEIEMELKETQDDDNKKQGTTFGQSVSHMIKASLGTGILAMPSAFKNAGYVIGFFGTLMIASLCTYTVHILTNSSCELSKGDASIKGLTYAETTEVAFNKGPTILRKHAKTARLVTETFIVLYQMGSSCIYVVFMAENLKAVVDVYVGVDTDIRLYMCILLFPLWLTTSLKDFKVLAPFSTVVTSMTIGAFGIIFYYIFRDLSLLKLRNKVGTASNIPLAFGTVLFAMEAIGAVLPLLNDIECPERFSSRFGVINISLGSISGLYLVVGLLGYLRYGEEIKGSITLVLPPDEILAQIVKLILLISIYVCYALSNLITFDVFEKWIVRTFVKNRCTADHALRMLIVFITFLLAVAIPNLEAMISLVGTLCLSTIGIALPAIIYQFTFNEHYRKKGQWSYALFCFSNFAIILVAIFSLVIGTYMSVLDIIKILTNNE